MPYLEYYPPQKGPVRRIPLNPLPFRIGRASASQFAIASYQVSKEHAEIFRVGDQYRIRDLNSTNGTFINGYRVTEAPLTDDDIFHVAHEEFRFIATSDEVSESPQNTELLGGKVPVSIARTSQHLQEMIRKQWVRMLFQPIVRLDNRDLIGYEALARGMHSDLSANPAELLALAERCGMLSSLSQLFRHMAVQDSRQLPCEKLLFLNLHPGEPGRDTFVESLRDLQEVAPAQRQIVLELHENVVCDMDALRRLRQQIKDLGMQVAYDDFGAGQARFLELTELPPDFVKLDMRLVRRIDQAEPRHNLIRALTHASLDLGIQVIAEGVETPEEAEVCQELGCQLGQGFFFGLPKAAAHLKPKEDRTHYFNVAELRARLRAQASKPEPPSNGLQEDAAANDGPVPEPAK
jgi:EAL domain-containing protein (putative c-di-GMP-specific phosphodiesterase class I)